MTKPFEFREGYVTSTVISMGMSEILRVLWEKDNKVRIRQNCSFEQYISYRNCCVYLECSTHRLYFVYLGNSRPTAANSFVQAPIQMDLVYSDNHRKSQLVSLNCEHRCNFQ